MQILQKEKDKNFTGDVVSLARGLVTYTTGLFLEKPLMLTY